MSNQHAASLRVPLAWRALFARRVAQKTSTLVVLRDDEREPNCP